MKKIVLFLSVLIAIFSIAVLTDVHANSQDRMVSIVQLHDSANIRTTGKQGMKFTATLLEPKAYKERGFYIVSGEYTRDQIVTALASGTKIDNKTILKKEISGITTNISVVIWNIPEAGYMTDLTAIAYVVLADGTKVYSPTAITRNISEIAVKEYEYNYGQYGEGFTAPGVPYADDNIIPDIYDAAPTIFDTDGAKNTIVTETKLEPQWDNSYDFVVKNFNNLTNAVVNQGAENIITTVANTGSIHRFWYRILIKYNEELQLWETVGAGNMNNITYDGTEITGGNSKTSTGATIASTGATYMIAHNTGNTTDTTNSNQIKNLYNLIAQGNKYYFEIDGFTSTQTPSTSSTWNGQFKVATDIIEVPGATTTTEVIVDSNKYDSGAQLPNITNDGYEFKGWFNERTGEPVTKIQQVAKNLIAKWGTYTADVSSSNEAVIESLGDLSDVLVVSSAFEDNKYYTLFDNTDINYKLGVNAFNTITDALAAVEEGQTIYVFDGTYNETVTITQNNVKLVGPNIGNKWDNSINAWTNTRSAEANITQLVEVKGDNVTIDGLQFTSDGAIRVFGNNTTIQNVNMEVTQILSEYTHYGLNNSLEYVDQAANRYGCIVDGTEMSNLKILNSRILGTKNGATVANDTTCVISLLVSNNTTIEGCYLDTQKSEINGFEGLFIYYIEGTFNFLNNQMYHWNSEDAPASISTSPAIMQIGYNPNEDGVKTYVNIIGNTFSGSEDGSKVASAICFRRGNEDRTVIVRGNTFKNFEDSFWLRYDGTRLGDEYDSTLNQTKNQGKENTGAKYTVTYNIFDENCFQPDSEFTNSDNTRQFYTTYIIPTYFFMDYNYYANTDYTEDELGGHDAVYDSMSFDSIEELKQVYQQAHPEDFGSCTISFDTDGGSTVDSIQYSRGDIVTLPIPTKDGLYFAGWYEGDTKVTQIEEYRNYYLIAHWSTEEQLDWYRVTYDAKGGQVAEQTQIFNILNYDTVEIQTPVRVGYTFEGWYENDVLIENISELRDYNLVAKWESMDINTTINYHFNDADTLSYDFILKNFNNSELETGADSGLIPVANANGIYMNRFWTRILIKYNSTTGYWDAVGLGYQGEHPDESVKNENQWTIEEGLIADTGATHVIGTHAHNTTDNKSDDANNNMIIIIAQMIEAGYTVKFNINGLTGDEVNEKDPEANWNGKIKAYITGMSNEAAFKYTKNKITLPTPEKAYYEFAGWYTTSDFTGNKVDEIVGNGSNQIINLYAKYSPTSYTISYDANGGIVDISEQEFNIENHNSIEHPTPTRKGYRFLGWYEETALIGALDARDYVLTAKWEELPINATVTYVPGEGASLDRTNIIPNLIANHEFMLKNFFYSSDENHEMEYGYDNGLTKVSHASAQGSAGPYMNYTWQRIFITYNEELGLWETIGAGSMSTKDESGIVINGTKYSGNNYLYDNATLISSTSATYCIGTHKTNSSSDANQLGTDKENNYVNSEKIVELYNLVVNGEKLYFDLGATQAELDSKEGDAFWNQNIKVYTAENINTSTTVVYTSNTANLPVATKPGYTFEGWYTTSTFDEGTKVDQILIENDEPVVMSLYAKFNKITYTITYNANGGEVETSQQEFDNETIGQVELQTPTRAGYNFLGWYHNGTQVTVIECQNYNLIAQWEKQPIAVNVTYNLNGGTPTEDFNFVIKNYNDNTDTDLMHGYDNGIVPVANTVDGTYMNRFWTRILINYNSELGYWESVGIGSSDGNSTAADGQKIVDIATYVIGTSPSNNTTDEEYNFANTNMISQLHNLIANGQKLYFDLGVNETELNNLANNENWNQNVKVYTLQTLQLKDQQVSVYTQATTDLPSPVKTGYTFAGWYTTETFDEGTKVTEIDADVTEPVSMTLYAKYELNVYTITYDADEGVVAEDSQEFTGADTLNTITLLVPTRTGYRFLGWYENANLVENITEYRNYHLTAEWEALPIEANVTYHLQGGTTEQVTQLYATFTELRTELYNDYKTYSGTSYTAEGLYALGQWNVPSTRLTKFMYDATYKAKWSWLIEVMLTQDLSANNRSHLKRYTTYNSFDELEAANANYKFSFGYELVGLMVAKQYSQNTTHVSLDYSNAAIQQAFLAAKTTITGGTNDVNITYTQTTSDLLAPTKQHYVFEGWYENAECTGDKVTEIYADTSGVEINLYAKYTPVDYVISLDANGGTTSESEIIFNIENMTSVVLPIPTRDESTFIGWYDGETLVETIEDLENYNLTAKWERLPGTATVNYHYGEGVVQEDYNFVIKNFNYNGDNGEKYLEGGIDLGITTLANNLTGTIMNRTWYRILVEYDNTTGLWKSIGAGYHMNATSGTQSYNTKLVDGTTEMSTLGDGESIFVIGTHDSNASDYRNDFANHNMIKALYDIVAAGEVLYFDLGNLFELAPTLNWYHDTKVYNETSIQTLYHEDTNTLPVGKLEGYRFDGWYDNAECTGDPVTSIYVSSKDPVYDLYAKYTLVEYKITYIVDSEEIVSTGVVGENVSLLQPTLDSKTFKYWIAEDGTTYTTTLNLAEFPDNRNITLKSVWATNTVVYHLNGGTYSGSGDIKVEEGEQIFVTITVNYNDAHLIMPTRDGYTFAGWYDVNGNKYTKPTDFTGDIDVFARWLDESVLIGSFETESYVTIGEQIQLNIDYAILPNTTPNFVWTSNNTAIATVDSISGVVTGVSAGVAEIVVMDTNNNGKSYTFYVTVLEEELSGIEALIVESNNSTIYTRDDLIVGIEGEKYANENPDYAGQGDYWHYWYFADDITESVSKLFFEDWQLHKNANYVTTPTSKQTYGKFSTLGTTVDFITFHYAADIYNLDGVGVDEIGVDGEGYLRGGERLTQYVNHNGEAVTASWHYGVGNDGAWAFINPEYTAFHAGSAKDMTWYATGIYQKPTDPVPYSYNVTLGDDDYYYLFGQKTKVQNTVQAGAKLNGMGLAIKVVNNQYYITGAYYNTTYKFLSSVGGNKNSIGIESSCAKGSDLWLTWQYSAQLCAQLLMQYDLPTTRLVGHHFFSGKWCPQPMLENDMEIWYKFVEMVETERNYFENYNNYSLTLTSNSTHIGSNGRVTSLPQYSECVTYDVTYSDGNTTKTITLSTILPGYDA